MLTLHQINQALTEREWKVELVRARDHFWLDGEDVAFAPSVVIPLTRINYLTLDQWMKRIEDIINTSHTRTSP